MVAARRLGAAVRGTFRAFRMNHGATTIAAPRHAKSRQRHLSSRFGYASASKGVKARKTGRNRERTPTIAPNATKNAARIPRDEGALMAAQPRRVATRNAEGVSLRT